MAEKKKKGNWWTKRDLKGLAQNVKDMDMDAFFSDQPSKEEAKRLAKRRARKKIIQEMRKGKREQNLKDIGEAYKYKKK